MRPDPVSPPLVGRPGHVAGLREAVGWLQFAAGRSAGCGDFFQDLAAAIHLGDLDGVDQRGLTEVLPVGVTVCQPDFGVGVLVNGSGGAADGGGGASDVDAVLGTEHLRWTAAGVVLEVGDQVQAAAGRCFPAAGNARLLARVHVVDPLSHCAFSSLSIPFVHVRFARPFVRPHLLHSSKLFGIHSQRETPSTIGCIALRKANTRKI